MLCSTTQLSVRNGKKEAYIARYFNDFVLFAVSINGRQDYDNTVQSVTFPPSTETAQRSVLIPYTNDEFNEATESFLLLARVVEATANPADIADLEYIRSGIAVAIIEDDDGKLTNWMNRRLPTYLATSSSNNRHQEYM